MPDLKGLRQNEDVARDIKRRFEQAVFFISNGLAEKDSLYEREPRKYPYSSVFRHGLNMLAALDAECSDDASWFLSGLSESSFLRDFATVDVRNWASGWRDDAKRALVDSDMMRTGPLAEVEGGFFVPTPECFEVIRFAESDLLGGYQERKAYEFLRAGTQSQYVLGRRLLVRHPILSWSEMMRLKTLRFDFSADPLDQGEGEAVDQDWLGELLDLAYEPVPGTAKVCPSCGWTMSMRGVQACCMSPSCTKTLPADFESLSDVPHDAFRLRKGVMHYISAPGGLELAVAEEALANGMGFELWPMKDTGDVMVTAPDGRRVVVDAKAYGSAEKLASEIRNDNAIGRLGADEVVYIVPDSVEKEHRGYCSVCNKALEGKADYSCCTYGKFAARLRKMKDGKRS